MLCCKKVGLESKTWKNTRAYYGLRSLNSKISLTPRHCDIRLGLLRVTVSKPQNRVKEVTSVQHERLQR